jgi:hypothetical protein
MQSFIDVIRTYSTVFRIIPQDSFLTFYLICESLLALCTMHDAPSPAASFFPDQPTTDHAYPQQDIDEHGCHHLVLCRS